MDESSESLNLKLEFTEWPCRASPNANANPSLSVPQRDPQWAVYVLWIHLLVSVLQCVVLLKGTSSMVRDDDAGPFVNNWDKEKSRAQDRHQEEGPQKHSIQNLGYKLPVLYHLWQKEKKMSVSATWLFILLLTIWIANYGCTNTQNPTNSPLWPHFLSQHAWLCSE